MNIHPTAIVHPSAIIEEGVTIGPYSIIEENTKIGAGTEIASCVRIYKFTEIGKDCKIFHCAAIGGPPQDLKFKNAISYSKIGDRNVFREFSTVNRATEEGQATIIGNDNLFMAYTHVAHNCKLGNGIIMANSANLGGHVEVEDYAIIGGVTGVHQFVKIGCYVMIGGVSRVVKDVLPYVKVADTPLKVAGLNTIGLQRRGFSNETIDILKDAYKLIFRSKFNVSQAVAKIKEELKPIPEILHIIEFIEKSERGIVL